MALSTSLFEFFFIYLIIFLQNLVIINLFIIYMYANLCGKDNLVSKTKRIESRREKLGIEGGKEEIKEG